MPNNLGITEVTLAQAADSTHAVNTVGWWDRPHVIRITNHASNVAAEEDDGEQMAIFERKAIGHPWMRRGTHLGTKRHETVDPATDSIPTDVEVLYPDWDYSEFE